ncbi:DUF6387 family protein [Serratia fonticola]|uniref:DUF6387 family protein n=1 Tax=Serratia fonticola TaxID=47917 RepID=UPI0034C6A264
MMKDRAALSECNWFDIKNYEFIDTLTVEEYLNEFLIRQSLFSAHPSSWRSDPEAKDVTSWIFGGKAHILAAMEEERKRYLYKAGEGPEGKLNYAALPLHLWPAEEKSFTGVDLLSGADIERCNNWMADRTSGHFLGPGRGALDIVDKGEALAKYAYPKNGQLLMSIDLKNHTDEELLNGLKAALAFWRVEFGVNTRRKKTTSQMTKSKVHKLYFYKTLPLVDICLWMIRENKTLITSDICRLLFHNPLKPKIKTTIKKEVFEKTFFKWMKWLIGGGELHDEGHLSEFIKLLREIPELGVKNMRTLCDEVLTDRKARSDSRAEKLGKSMK